MTINLGRKTYLRIFKYTKNSYFKKLAHLKAKNRKG